MVETGIGFGFLAVVISYLPVLYQAFSRREVTISLLDARRLAADGRHAPGPSGPVQRSGPARPVPRRVGALGGRGAREPHLVPRPELLPLAARQPVVAGRADGHPRHLGPGRAAVPKGDRSQAWMAFAMGRHVVVDLARSSTPRPSIPRPIGSLPSGGTPSASSSARRGWSSTRARPSSGGSWSCGGCTSPSSLPCRSVPDALAPRRSREASPWTTGRPAPGCAGPRGSVSSRRPSRGRP